jgi:hypothetical protein
MKSFVCNFLSNDIVLTVAVGLVALMPVRALDAVPSPPPADWLVNPSSFKARVASDPSKNQLVLDNGLVRRTLVLAPNAATVDYLNRVTGEQLLRAVGPEARVTLNGTTYAVGGLSGQPTMNFLKPEWFDALQADPAAYRFADWKEVPLAPRLEWKKRPAWLARDLPWPPPGKQVTLRFLAPAQAPDELTGKTLFDERFLTKLAAGWQTHVSAKNPRSSFCNEGKPGEIYTPVETAVYAERAWPTAAASVEVKLDTGDDTQTNAWGPGLALVSPAGTIAFITRPNQRCYDLNGQLSTEKFDRSKPVYLRVRLTKTTAVCEASQDGASFKRIGRLPLPQLPVALRVGRVGRNGLGVDDESATSEPLVRCHISQVTIRAAEAAGTVAAPRTDLPEIQLHYAIYDGIPLMEKWLTLHNRSNTPVRINKTVVETLKIAENESSVEENPRWESPNLYVETDYACANMTAKGANQRTVRFGPDPDYHTQVNFEEKTPALLEVAPEFGPDIDLAPNNTFTSIRAFELLLDSSERERRGLAQRRMYRTIAPWTQENPVMVHLISSEPATIRGIIDQGAEVGVEMIILSFGSGMNLENTDAKYQATYKELADYAATKGIVLGAYSLLASRGAATAADNCRGPGNRVRYGVMPCLGAKWGQDYLTQLKSFITQTGFAILEHDGSYPGDTCAATDHPLHHGLEDSQWVQFQAITNFYKWCRANGIYLNIPDWYYLNGGSKCGMNYKETNWSLPRADQEIIERQNIYDGTWEKIPSMGWMMVPLTQYHGGGAAATIEPLKDHLPHYETRLANLFGAGVQACYRGPRIYDTDDTKALVKKWITFYKSHREVLDADLIHLRRPDGRDWDGFVHVNPQGKEKALAMFYNPLASEITRTIRVPLRYAGLVGMTRVSVNGASPVSLPLDRTDTLTLEVRIPAGGRRWVVFTPVT